MSDVIDNVSAALACEFWAQADRGMRGEDLRNAAKFLRTPSFEVDRLRGQIGVMYSLLGEAFLVINDLRMDSDGEDENALFELQKRISVALQTVANSTLLKAKE